VALFAFCFTSLTSAPTQPITRAIHSVGTNAGYIGGDEYHHLSHDGFVPSGLIAFDRIQDYATTINILRNLSVIEKANSSVAAQIADARKFASALPLGLAVPRIWTDGDSEVVFEWIKGEKHAIVSFEGGGNFGYAMKRGDRFEPGVSPNDINVAVFDDLNDYLAQL
jgi:hypothetical protein